MADKRKPEAVVLLRRGPAPTVKVEVFSARQFPALGRFTDRHGRPINPDRAGDFYRLRVNGAWLPLGRRTLYTKNQISALIRNEVFQ